MRDGRFKTAVRTFIRIKTKIDGTTEDSIENILISHITHSIVIVKLSNIIDIIKKNIIKRFLSRVFFFLFTILLSSVLFV